MRSVSLDKQSHGFLKNGKTLPCRQLALPDKLLKNFLDTGKTAAMLCLLEILTFAGC
jgi:hypothetical protein